MYSSRQAYRLLLRNRASGLPHSQRNSRSSILQSIPIWLKSGTKNTATEKSSLYSSVSTWTGTQLLMRLTSVFQTDKILIKIMGSGIPLPFFFCLYKNGSPIWTAEIFAPLSFNYFDDSESEDSGLKLASNVKTSFVPSFSIVITPSLSVYGMLSPSAVKFLSSYVSSCS